MKKIDLITPAARIRHGDDAVSQRFAEQHLEPLVPKLKTALDAIARMHNLLTEAQRDCDQ
jgi:hypothetical protein